MHRKLEAAVASVLMLVSIFAVLNSPIVSGEVPSEDPVEEWIDYVNPFIGVGDGHCYPAVCEPFGFTQWTPQSRRETGGTGVPYWGDASITGFRGSHYPSGACMRDYASVTIQPQAGVLKTTADARNTLMDDIDAHPDYFAVTLKDDFDVRAEVTATMHCGIFRITYLGSGDAHILVDAHYLGSAEVDSANNEIRAQNVQHGYWSKIVGYSVVKFNKSFIPSSEADGQFAHADFHVNSGDTIIVKVGTSYISFDQARASLDAEIPDWDFDQVRSETREIWNQELGKIEVEGGTEDQKVIFYTALYHCLLLPRVFSEQGRYYSAFDDKVHDCTWGEYYNDFSLWDTYRSEHSLLCLLVPEREEDMCQAMVSMYEEGGWFPKWPNPGYSSVMIGTHTDSVITETYLKGLTDFDIETAYEGSLKHATTRGPVFYEARGGIEYYIDLGYVPADMFGEATSRTLEFAYDDYCLAQLAKVLGKEDDYEMFIERAGYYKNVYDPTAPGEPFPGFVRGRNADGSWTNPGTFKPTAWYGYITEGDSYQYTWYVPQDVQGLIDLMGGRDNFNAKLDYFFEHSPWAVGSDLSAYYWHGNEPSQHDVYLYSWSGQPWKTQELARKVMETRYWTVGSALQGGICVNDDCGQTSSWYVLSAMGFYPVCPAQTTYQIGSPIFDKVTVHLDPQYYPGGDFVIIAHNNSAENMYIQSAKLNGEPLDRSWFWHSDLEKGGTLEFWMGPEPNHEWGSDPEDAPPSMWTVETQIVPAEFVLENLSIVPEEVEPGEEVIISADVANIGGSEGTYTVELKINGEVVDDQTVTLVPDESDTVMFTVTKENEGTYGVEVDGLTGSFEVTTMPAQAEFELTDLSVSKPEVGPGEQTEVSAVVTNVGGASGTLTVEFTIDGEAVDSQTVTLVPGESDTVTFTVSRDEEGTYDVGVDGLVGSFEVVVPSAEFVVENLSISPDEVEPGENVAISVDVANIGDASGTLSVELEVDGEVVDNQTVTLGPGESDTVSFTVSRGEEGTYDVEVDGLTGDFEVAVPLEGVPVWPIAVAIVVIIAVVGGILYRRRK